MTTDSALQPFVTDLFTRLPCVGEAVVWYVRHRGGIVISCFVPADAV
jgi:hypothetical protein